MQDLSSDHRHAWDAIPWVVNGSASADDRQAVESHVSVCADCRAELNFHRELQRGMLLDAAHAGPAPDSQAAQATADAGLQRLWAQIDEAVDAPAPEPRRRSAWPPVTRWLTAAVVVQAVGLAALATVVYERGAAAPYQTLSRPEALPAGPLLRLVPAPALRVGELQQLLARSGLQVVGSNADGTVLTLAARGAATSQPLSIDARLATLRAAPGVLLAEPVQ